MSDQPSYQQNKTNDAKFAQNVEVHVVRTAPVSFKNTSLPGKIVVRYGEIV